MNGLLRTDWKTEGIFYSRFARNRNRKYIGEIAISFTKECKNLGWHFSYSEKLEEKKKKKKKFFFSTSTNRFVNDFRNGENSKKTGGRGGGGKRSLRFSCIWDLHVELSHPVRNFIPAHCYFISAQSVHGLVQSGQRQPDAQPTNFSNRVSLTKSCSRVPFASVHM